MKNKLKKITYIQLIRFCAELPFQQLLAFKEQYKSDKNKEYLIACEVLKIRMRKRIVI